MGKCFNIKKDDEIMKNVFKLFFREQPYKESLSKETIYLRDWRINYIARGVLGYRNYMAIFLKCIKIPSL